MAIKRSSFLVVSGVLLAGCLMSRLNKVDATDSGDGEGGSTSAGTSARAGTGNTSGGSQNVGDAGAPGSGGSDVTVAGTPGTGGASVIGGSGGASGGVNTGGSNQGGSSNAGTGGSVVAGGSGGMPACADNDPLTCTDEIASAKSSFNNAGWKDSWWLFGCVVKAGQDCISNPSTCNVNDGPTPEEKGNHSIESWHLGGEKANTTR